MSHSKFMAERFALDLSGVALGMWEAARLVTSDKTRENGLLKVKRLRQRLKSFKRQPFLSDSLRIYLKKEFDHNEYESILNRIDQRNNIKAVFPEIEKLVKTTREYLDETRRTRTNIQKPL